MVKLIRYGTLLALILSTFVACNRQPIYSLESQISSAKIEFVVDWTESNIEVSDINNISIYGYDKNLDSPYTKVSGDIYYSYLSLGEGSYSFLVFNDFVGDIKGVSFSDVDFYDLFRAEVNQQAVTTGLYYELQTGEVLAAEMGQIASWQMELFEVNAEMIVCSCCEIIEDETAETILELSPQALTTRCTVDLGVDNLNNAAYIESSVRGLASGVYLTSNVRFSTEDVTTIYSVELDSRTYNNSSDGVAQGVFNSFGKSSDEEQSYEVVINVILNSGVLATFSRDVTDQLLAQDNIEILIDLTSADDRILLPESTDSTFGVNDWGDNEQVELI